MLVDSKLNSPIQQIFIDLLTMIKFANVKHSFGAAQVLEGINFQIALKEFVFLVGRSGCGKTTLLRLLNLEFPPTSGDIFFEDQKLSQIPNGKIWQYRRKLGMIFQDMKLLFDRNVFENVALSLELRGNSPAEIKKKIHEILDLVGLKDKQFLFPKELSGGEVQRTAIARAIIGNPQVILADEPTADLDVATGWEIVQILQMLNRAGKTIIMATHNIDIVNSLTERAILLEKGKVIKDVKEEKIKI